MALQDTIKEEVETILSTAWDVRNGTVIPGTSDITLADGAVKLHATFLYADLAGSSVLAKVCPWETTAKIIRAYLNSCVRVIRAHGGEIRSFDGDRVMGVFIGDSPNTSAVNCARKIDWIIEKVINPKAKTKFKSIKDNNIEIKHCVGIDIGNTHAVRAGIRSNNDLIWIGKAPSFAAKLSDIREYPFSVFISKACYDKLNESAKREGVWEQRTYTFAGQSETIYRTRYILEP